MATIHVAKTGNDTTGNGSSGTPYLTIQKGVNVATAAGDTVSVHVGTYSEIVTFGSSGSSGNVITLTNAGDGTVTINGVSGSQYVVVIDSKSYITIDGISITYSTSHTYPANKNWPWLRIAGTANHITVKNCNFTKDISDLIANYNTGQRDPAIRIGDNANNIVIENNVFSKCNKAIQIQSGSSIIRVSGNTISNTVQSGIAINGPSNGLRDLLIYNNIIEGSQIEDGIQFTQDFSLSATSQETDVTNQGTIIYRNVIRNHGENAIDLKGARYIVIDGNIIYGIIGSDNGDLNGYNSNAYRSITRGANTSTQDHIIRNNIIYDSSAGGQVWQGTHFYNNTLVWNNRTGAGSGQNIVSASAQTPKQDGIFDQLGSAITQVAIINNIIANHNGASITLRTTLSRGLRIDNNAHVGNSPAVYTGTSWSNYTLANWKTHLAGKGYDGAEANSFALADVAAVKFRILTDHPTGDYTALNFELQDDSPCKATGGHLTYANGSGSSATVLFVDDAGFFTDWQSWGAYGSDVITINGQTRTITDVDYTNNSVTLSAAATWADNAKVYYGPSSTPDIGAPGFGVDPTTPPSPPSTGGGYVVTRAAANTSTGNQTFTIPSGLSGTPAAAMFEVTYATADGTAAVNAVLGQGYTDGTNQTCYAIRDENGVNPSDSSRETDATACILILNPANGAVLGRATFVSWSSTTVVVNWATAPSSAYLVTVTAIEATDAYVTTSAIHATQNSSVTVTPGFQFSAVFAFSNGKAAGSGFTHHRISLGYGTYYQSTLTQNCVSFYSQDNLSPTQSAARATPSRISSYITSAGNTSWSIELTNVTSTTVDLTTRDGTPSETEELGLLFIKTTAALWTGYIDIPSTAATTQYTAAAFKAGMVKSVTTFLTATASADVTDNSGAYGLSTLANLAYSNAISFDDAATTSATKSISNDQPLDVYDATGAASITATSYQFLSTGWEVGYSAVPGTVRKALAIAFQTAVSVTAAFSATPLTGDAPLAVTFTDASTANGTTITTYSLDVGDGTAAITSSSPWSHTYTSVGTYTVTLTVGDGNQSNTRTRTDYITVTQPSGTAAPSATLWGVGLITANIGSPISGGAF